jgi:LPPG:FO 2-phospho-L-lactate transferase
MLVALAGGVGAARFLAGLVRVVPPETVTVVVNTADDEEIHGLHVSPDLDTVTYTLAGAADPERGWGLAGDTHAVLDALDRYGEPTWFRIGDRDLATHLHRTRRLRAGATLSEVTDGIRRSWGVACRLLPMSDDPVRTRIEVDGPDGPVELALQEWFVRERAEPRVRAVRFQGVEQARPAPGVIEALAAADTVLICPSNPVISIGPILATPGVRDALAARRDRVVAVSPIVGGRPVKGPADRLMRPLGMEVSCVGVAAAYAPVCRALVVDHADADAVPRLARLGVEAVVTDTLMVDARVAAALASTALAAVA